MGCIIGFCVGILTMIAPWLPQLCYALWIFGPASDAAQARRRERRVRWSRKHHLQVGQARWTWRYHNETLLIVDPFGREHWVESWQLAQVFGLNYTSLRLRGQWEVTDLRVLHYIETVILREEAPRVPRGTS